MPVSNPASGDPEILNPQARIKELAEERLRRNPYSPLKNVCCDYLDGVLLLRGFLPTYYLKQVAQEAVADLEGVSRTDNQIQVGTAT